MVLHKKAFIEQFFSAESARFCDISSKKIPKRSLSVGNLQSPKRGRPKRNIDFNLLILPIGNYQTEDEDDKSDWEDHLWF